MDDSSSNLKIYFDDENKIRIFNPESIKLTKSLVKQCSHFIESNKDTFLVIIDIYSKNYSKNYFKINSKIYSKN